MEVFIDKIKLLSGLSFNNIENNTDPMQVYLHMRQQIIEAEEEKVIKPRYGTWVKENDDTYSCSECGHDEVYTFDGTRVLGVTCPFCAAIMRVED